jgi:hypothetical protein
MGIYTAYHHIKTQEIIYAQGIGSRFSYLIFQFFGKPGALTAGAPSQPAAIIATAVSKPPLPGR